MPDVLVKACHTMVRYVGQRCGYTPKAFEQLTKTARPANAVNLLLADVIHRELISISQHGSSKHTA